MPAIYPAAMSRLINELSKLPSIGERSATRLAYHLLTAAKSEGVLLARVIEEALNKIRLCDICFFLTEEAICPICSDPRREKSLLCVVEKPADVIAIERSGSYHGLYHVLHGVWSPLRGVSPEQTKIGNLIERLAGKGSRDSEPLVLPVKELILATSTTVEGDATALYIASSVEEFGVPITRIAQGLPKGGELEYADQMTLHLSLEGRREI